MLNIAGHKGHVNQKHVKMPHCYHSEDKQQEKKSVRKWGKKETS
jgi:hypothetical protein